jgi:hypothetical protein
MAVSGGPRVVIIFPIITKIPLIALWWAGLAPAFAAGSANIQQSLRSAGYMRAW